MFEIDLEIDLEIVGFWFSMKKNDIDADNVYDETLINKI